MASLTASASRFKVTSTAANISLAAASTARCIHTTPYARNRTADKELCLSVLASASTKREARSYLKRFSPAPAILKYLNESSFAQPDTSAQPPPLVSENGESHVGIVKIRDASAIDAPTLRGIGRTLTQLALLGLPTAVIIDEAPSPATAVFRTAVETQADRVVSAIEAAGGRARRVDGCTGSTSAGTTPPLTIRVPELLLAPLARGVIPVLPPLALDTRQRLAAATGDQLLLSLTALLVERGMAVDRIMLLDPLGGIPSHDRPAGAHVFINLAQEHDMISNFLHPSSPHARNLQVLRAALSGLPATSSAIITTPALAASTTTTTTTMTTPSRRTPPKKAKNPLIHNLLTDKPLTSSSLPVQAHNTAGTLTTLLKRGIPLSVHLTTHLTDPSIDLPKLVALVEDSFGKRLDLQHYLRRVEGNIAALVVAGDYEGAAIVTWEYPHCDGPGEDGRGKRVLYLDKFAVLKRSQGTGGVADVVFKGMVEAVRRGALDAEGIVWRSRRWNPVNKWYFERAKGTYKIPDSGWTMFWTSRGGDVEPVGKETDSEAGVRRFMEYERICRAIVPSLVDE